MAPRWQLPGAQEFRDSVSLPDEHTVVRCTIDLSLIWFQYFGIWNLEVDKIEPDYSLSSANLSYR